MSATKKQVNDIENAVVILEERIEKVEEENQLLKQMISMQSTLIDNLQMMVKMMSVSAPATYKVMHVGGTSSSEQNEADNKQDNTQQDETQEDKQIHRSIRSLKTRMSRVA